MANDVNQPILSQGGFDGGSVAPVQRQAPDLSGVTSPIHTIGSGIVAQSRREDKVKYPDFRPIVELGERLDAAANGRLSQKDIEGMSEDEKRVAAQMSGAQPAEKQAIKEGYIKKMLVNHALESGVPVGNTDDYVKVVEDTGVFGADRVRSTREQALRDEEEKVKTEVINSLVATNNAVRNSDGSLDREATYEKSIKMARASRDLDELPYLTKEQNEIFNAQRARGQKTEAYDRMIISGVLGDANIMFSAAANVLADPTKSTQQREAARVSLITGAEQLKYIVRAKYPADIADVIDKSVDSMISVVGKESLADITDPVTGKKKQLELMKYSIGLAIVKADENMAYMSGVSVVNANVNDVMVDMLVKNKKFSVGKGMKIEDGAVVPIDDKDVAVLTAVVKADPSGRVDTNKETKMAVVGLSAQSAGNSVKQEDFDTNMKLTFSNNRDINGQEFENKTYKGDSNTEKIVDLGASDGFVDKVNKSKVLDKNDIGAQGLQAASAYARKEFMTMSNSMFSRYSDKPVGDHIYYDVEIGKFVARIDDRDVYKYVERLNKANKAFMNYYTLRVGKPDNTALARHLNEMVRGAKNKGMMGEIQIVNPTHLKGNQ